MLRHYETLRQLSLAGNRAIIALCFMYDAPLFTPPPVNDWNRDIIDSATHAKQCGVELWQINLRISPDFIEIARCEQLS
jgi:hypothetical protein